MRALSRYVLAAQPLDHAAPRSLAITGAAAALPDANGSAASQAASAARSDVLPPTRAAAGSDVLTPTRAAAGALRGNVRRKSDNGETKRAKKHEGSFHFLSHLSGSRE